MRVICYLDDFLILAETEDLARKHTNILLQLLLHFGFTPNWSKSVLQPSQTCEFLGTMIDSVRMSLSVPTKKLRKYKAHAKRMLRRARKSVGFQPSPPASDSLSQTPVGLTELRRLVGQLQSCSQCIPVG
jgi:hypothetical protein